VSIVAGGPTTMPIAIGVARCQIQRITPRAMKLPTRAPTPSAIALFGESGPTGLTANRPSSTSVPSTLAETSEESSSMVE
jgi:hypothetical protein